MKLLSIALTLVLFCTNVYADISSCPLEGNATQTQKKALNRLKNRDSMPSKVKELTVNEFIKLSDAQRLKNEDGIALVGYVLGAKQSGAESPNCGSETDRDWHVWIGNDKPEIGANPKTLRSNSVVVEPTPRTIRANRTWNLKTLLKLSKQGAKVRITGWVMYDPEHPSEIGKTRGTIWEVHPVTKIEVWNGGVWRTL